MRCPLAEMAARQPEAPAIIAPDRTWTYAACDAAASPPPGLSPGEVVTIEATPTVATVLALLGVLRGGGTALMLAPDAPAAYREEVMTRVAGGGAPPGVLVLTSGSTGTPKAALLSLANLRAHARLSNGNIVVGPGDGWLLSLSLHHVAGLGVLFRCLEGGGAVVLPRGDAPLAEDMERPEVTHASLVAAQLHGLEAAPETLRRKKALLIGGSAIPETLIRRAHDLGLPIHTTYGLTEGASQVCTTPPGADLDTLLTSGMPLGEGLIRIDGDGQIRISGPARFQGYLVGGVLETPFDGEGWFATGDLGHFDGQGRLHVTGRVDNRFTCGGENVQPEQVEAAMLRLPGVTRALVVPVRDAVFGNVAAAFVEGSAPLENLREVLAEQLPRHQAPRHFFPWPDDLTPEGQKPSRPRFAARAMQLLRER